jgi:hypothetical protein
MNRGGKTDFEISVTHPEAEDAPLTPKRSFFMRYRFAT